MLFPILIFIFYKMLFLLFRFSQFCTILLICIPDCFNLRYKGNYNFCFIIPVSLLPFPFLFSFLFCSAENWTHGLTHAWQELFYWVTSPVLFTLFSWPSHTEAVWISLKYLHQLIILVLYVTDFYPYHYLVPIVIIYWFSCSSTFFS